RDVRALIVEASRDTFAETSSARAAPVALIQIPARSLFGSGNRSTPLPIAGHRAHSEIVRSGDRSRCPASAGPATRISQRDGLPPYHLCRSYAAFRLPSRAGRT